MSQLLSTMTLFLSKFFALSSLTARTNQRLTSSSSSLYSTCQVCTLTITSQHDILRYLQLQPIYFYNNPLHHISMSSKTSPSKPRLSSGAPCAPPPTQNKRRSVLDADNNTSKNDTPIIPGQSIDSDSTISNEDTMSPIEIPDIADPNPFGVLSISDTESTSAQTPDSSTADVKREEESPTPTRQAITSTPLTITNDVDAEVSKNLKIRITTSSYSLPPKKKIAKTLSMDPEVVRRELEEDRERVYKVRVPATPYPRNFSALQKPKRKADEKRVVGLIPTLFWLAWEFLRRLVEPVLGFVEDVYLLERMFVLKYFCYPVMEVYTWILTLLSQLAQDLRFTARRVAQSTKARLRLNQLQQSQQDRKHKPSNFIHTLLCITFLLPLISLFVPYHTLPLSPTHILNNVLHKVDIQTSLALPPWIYQRPLLDRFIFLTTAMTDSPLDITALTNLKHQYHELDSILLHGEYTARRSGDVELQEMNLEALRGLENVSEEISTLLGVKIDTLPQVTSLKDLDNGFRDLSNGEVKSTTVLEELLTQLLTTQHHNAQTLLSTLNTTITSLSHLPSSHTYLISLINTNHNHTTTLLSTPSSFLALLYSHLFPQAYTRELNHQVALAREERDDALRCLAGVVTKVSIFQGILREDLRDIEEVLGPSGEGEREESWLKPLIHRGGVEEKRDEVLALKVKVQEGKTNFEMGRDSWSSR
jgi:hypothetical protein